MKQNIVHKVFILLFIIVLFVLFSLKMCNFNLFKEGARNRSNTSNNYVALEKKITNNEKEIKSFKKVIDEIKKEIEKLKGLESRVDDVEEQVEGIGDF